MSVLLLLLAGLVLLYLGANWWLGAIGLVVATGVGFWLDSWHWLSVFIGTVLLLGTLVVIIPSPLRRNLISSPLLGMVRGMLPTLSDTEQQALNAGSVDWDGQLFSGRPDWQHLLDLPHPKLTQEEQAFIDGPVDELCAMLDDWSITNERYDLPEEAWKFIREKGFFGLVIGKEHGGLGFSNTAHSQVVMKIASRGVSAAVTVMVPNSLGPGELITYYGTDEQKQYYLPRLAKGDEVPCFALTSPVAGSDAGAIPDRGVICRGYWNGQEVLGMKVTWNKRYITLAPVATLIGLAIKVYDPDHLLGDEHDLGVTAVMVPADTEGVNHGPRHLPMNTVFMNGPTWGEDVFIPLEQVIGGREMIGQGWRMLLECLSIGRSISLPALGTGAGKMACLTTGSYAAVREQFGRSISDFEGVQEALEPMAGYTWMMDAARTFTSGMLDRGVKPSVPSALLKYRNTDLMRKVVTNAMDVVAGRGVIKGPRNFLARIYQAIPIAITVEGANILTRSLIIYGQGALRCHPYVYREMQAVRDPDATRASKEFDGALFGHVGLIISNAVRALLLGLSGARLAMVPGEKSTRRYLQRLTRMSAAFAFASDAAILTLGGALKRKEKLSGRLADVLSYLYLASATVKRFRDDGEPAADAPLVRWVCELALHRIEHSLDGFIRNFPNRAVAGVLRAVIFPLGRWHAAPADTLGAALAGILLEPGESRDRLTAGMHLPREPREPLGELEDALEKACAAEPVERKLRAAVREGRLASDREDVLVTAAYNQGIIDEAELKLYQAAAAARERVIQVDAFPREAFGRSTDHGTAEDIQDTARLSG